MESALVGYALVMTYYRMFVILLIYLFNRCLVESVASMRVGALFLSHLHNNRLYGYSLSSLSISPEPPIFSEVSKFRNDLTRNLIRTVDWLLPWAR